MNYIYSKEQGRLLSMPVMKFPNICQFYNGLISDNAVFDSYEKAEQAYQEWLSNQPLADAKDFEDGKVYVKDVDFKLIDGYDSNETLKCKHCGLSRMFCPCWMAIPIKKETERGIISQAKNPDETLLASHSCTSGNSIEQVAKEFAIDYLTFMILCKNGYYDEEGNYIEGHTHTAPIVSALTEATGELKTTNGKQLLSFLKRRLASLLNTEQNKQ
jgi:hypothetical protein